MWQRNDQRTPGTPVKGRPSEGYAEAPEREAQPLLLWTSGLREARVTEPHAPATACRHRSPPGSLRLPTGSPLQISNESSRSRAAGVMATSDRQGPTPLAFSNLPRMLASGTERNRGRNETTAPLASRCFGNKKRQPSHLPGQGRGPRGPKPKARDSARSSKARWHVGKVSPHGTAATSERRRFAEKVNPFSSTCGRKAQGSNERQPVATLSDAADLISGARP
jgi:hypothetical protein